MRAPPAAPRRRRRATPAAGQATPESIEAEIARSEHAELQALLKQHFADEYKELIAVAVRRRNEGASEQDVGQRAWPSASRTSCGRS